MEQKQFSQVFPFLETRVCISSLESLKILEKFYLPDTIISEGLNEMGQQCSKVTKWDKQTVWSHKTHFFQKAGLK